MKQPTVRPEIAAIMPARMKRRPVDHRGYPVPWFVTILDDTGKWDFRLVEGYMLRVAIQERRCWICGQRLGTHVAFAVGPMCGVNRISGEPPQHQACSEFAVRVCPFMLSPIASRRTKDLPEGVESNPGALKRNPGVTLIWSTATFEVIPNGKGYLFGMGKPTAISFWTEGRQASRDEIDESVAGGFPTLDAMAKAEGPVAIQALSEAVAIFEELLPA